MKILLAHCFYRSTAPSGEDMVYRREKQLLLDAGHEVICYEKHNDDLDNSNLPSQLQNATDCIWSRSAKRELASLLKTQKPDLAHFHNTFPQMSLSVYQACRNAGIPVVQTLHNYRSVCANGLLMREGRPCEACIQPGRPGIMPALAGRCYRDSLSATLPLALQIALTRRGHLFERLATRLIALTGFARDKFVQAGFNPEQISIKPNFVADPIAPDQLSALPFERAPYAIFVGRLSQEKGIHTLINAWHSVPGLTLKVVGDGELMPMLREQVEAQNLNVELLGQQDNRQVLQLIRHARFQIVPSECYEGFPAVIAEAFACGTPVLASRIGGLPELIDPGRTGDLFSVGNPHELAAHVMRWLNAPDHLQRMSHNCRMQYQNLYTPESNLHALESIYHQALNSRLNTAIAIGH